MKNGNWKEHRDLNDRFFVKWLNCGLIDPSYMMPSVIQNIRRISDSKEFPPTLGKNWHHFGILMSS